MIALRRVPSIIRNRTKALFKTRFNRRIQKRFNIFWKKSNDLDKIKIKLHSSTPMEEWQNLNNWQRRLENKFNAKEFAKKLGCRVAILYWHGGKEEFLKFDLYSLPENFIVKPIMDHSSRNVFIMRSGVNLLNHMSLTLEELKIEILKLYEAQPDLELLIEEFIPNEDGNYAIPIDYKFFMFNGHLSFIQVIHRSKTQKKMSFYDVNWNMYRKNLSKFNTGTDNPPPLHLNEMIAQAKKLSKIYQIFVRIDFYDSPKGVVFGEFTPTPRGGQGFTRYGSRILIKAWDKYCPNLI